MNIENILQIAIIGAIKELYDADVNASQITLQKTKKEFPTAEIVIATQQAVSLNRFFAK